jgi:hypothetical protein
MRENFGFQFIEGEEGWLVVHFSRKQGFRHLEAFDRLFYRYNGLEGL